MFELTFNVGHLKKYNSWKIHWFKQSQLGNVKCPSEQLEFLVSYTKETLISNLCKNKIKDLQEISANNRVIDFYCLETRI